MKHGIQIKSGNIKIPNCILCEVFAKSKLGNHNTEEAEHQFIRKHFLTFEKNDILFREGDDVSGVFCIYSGMVKILKKVTTNQDYIIRLTKPGDLLGLSLFTTKRHINTAIALERVQVCYIPQYEFLSYIRKNPELSMTVMKILCEEIEFVENRITGFSKKNARERVAEMLVSLKTLYGTDSEKFLNIFLTWEELANFAGTSSSTLLRLMNDFKKMNLIRIHKHKIQMLNLERLAQIAKV